MGLGPAQAANLLSRLIVSRGEFDSHCSPPSAPPYRPNQTAEYPGGYKTIFEDDWHTESGDAHEERERPTRFFKGHGNPAKAARKISCGPGLRGMRPVK